MKQVFLTQIGDHLWQWNSAPMALAMPIHPSGWIFHHYCLSLHLALKGSLIHQTPKATQDHKLINARSSCNM